MASKSPRTPKSTLKLRRLPKEGDEIRLTARVTRTGRNTWDTGDTVTVRIPGFETPITIEAHYLPED